MGRWKISTIFWKKQSIILIHCVKDKVIFWRLKILFFWTDDLHYISRIFYFKCLKIYSRVKRRLGNFIFLEQLYLNVIHFSQSPVFSLFLFVCLMMFNATFNNISVKSWQSVLLVEETGKIEKSHWQTLSHNVVHLALIEIQTHISCDRHWLHK